MVARHSSGGDPRFQILFPVWTNPLLYSVYSERSCLRRSTESRDLRSSPSIGCHGHRQGCITPETCPHKPEAELRKVDVRLCGRNSSAYSLRRTTMNVKSGALKLKDAAILKYLS